MTHQVMNVSPFPDAVNFPDFRFGTKAYTFILYVLSNLLWLDSTNIMKMFEHWGIMIKYQCNERVIMKKQSISFYCPKTALINQNRLRCRIYIYKFRKPFLAIRPKNSGLSEKKSRY